MTNYNELRDGQEFFANGYRKGYEDAKKEFERHTGKWIPVSERLPKEANRSYLVTVDYNGIVCSCQRFFFGEGIGWNDDSVIAWQPLPKPFKKGSAS